MREPSIAVGQVFQPRLRHGVHAQKNVPMTTAIRFIWVTALLLTGCASIGPPTVVRDRFDYVAAISDSWKRQMLQNLLKIRYGDAPVFMDVTSVISAYSVQNDISIGGQITPLGRNGDTFASAGAGVQYADKPTITYQPLSGDKFARSLMTPIPVTGVLALIQAGYPADLVLRFCVNSINGLENDFGGQSNPRAGNPKFHELLTNLRQSQAAGGAGFRIKATKDRQTAVIFFRPSTEESESLTRRIRELLGIDPVAREFTIVYGSFPEPDGEIAILTRSILQVMIDLASQIEVPAADIADGRVYSPQRTAEQQRMFPPMLAIRHGSSPSEDAYAAVRYRDQSFWIDDRDQQSKRTLLFLMMIFSLTESVPAQPAPVVTIPAR
jgi:hypothetical protein